MLVYRFTNLLNGKVYIGQTAVSMKRRLEFHRWSVIKGRKQAVHHAIAKYGWDNFKIEVLHEAKNLAELNAMETFFIIMHQSFLVENGYNRNLGGYKRKNIGQIPWNKGKKAIRPPWNKGMKMSEEFRDKCRSHDMSKAHEAKAKLPPPPKTDHWRQVMASCTGKKNHYFGLKHSPETRTKMRDAKLRYIATVPNAIEKLLSNLKLGPV